MQYSRTLTINIYHSNKWGPPLFLHLDTSFVIGHALVHSVDKTHVLVVTVDLIWLLFLNILSFNFVATPRKSLRFTRFIRSYVNRPAVVLSNHCQSYTALLFCLMCSLQSCHIPFFCSCLFPMIVHLRCWANPLPEFCDLQGGQERNKSEIVINISNLTVGVSIPSAAKQRYFLISIQYRRKVWNVCPLYNINIMIFPLHI